MLDLIGALDSGNEVEGVVGETTLDIHIAHLTNVKMQDLTTSVVTRNGKNDASRCHYCKKNHKLGFFVIEYHFSFKRAALRCSLSILSLNEAGGIISM